MKISWPIWMEYQFCWLSIRAENNFNQFDLMVNDSMNSFLRRKKLHRTKSLIGNIFETVNQSVWKAK